MFCSAVLAIAFTALMSWSCSEIETMEEQENVKKVYTANLVFDGILESFDAPTRAASSSWMDEAQVFLQFSVGERYVQGSAIYDAGTDKWNLEFYEAITEGQELNCHAYYFENALDVTYEGVVLDETSVVYRDVEATYFYDGSTLTVNAHLAPVTGRIRFEGKPGAAYNFFGPTKCTYYNFATNKLSTETKEFVSNVPESGKSGYYYVYFNEYSPREIYFYDQDNNVRYSKKYKEEVLAPGTSGYMDIPTADNRNGWSVAYLKKTYTVGDVSFNMILVDKGTFAMGYSKNPNYEEAPVHNVTLTQDYYIGETEVTQDLWEAVMTGTGDVMDEDEEVMPNYPKSYVSFNEINDFIGRLGRILGSSFTLPTEAQWEFAAKGGNKSKGYVYAGSDSIDEVAWYYDNSDYRTIEEVKLKKPNELGIYDMSGNVKEFCSDYKIPYPSEDVVDPYQNFQSGSYRAVRGGAAYNDVKECSTTYRTYETSYGEHTGFRLASY